MDVKTNKEYTAMLHEIEGVEREIRGREDQILAEMESAETLAADLKKEEEVFRKEEARHKQDVAALEGQRRELDRRAGSAWPPSASRWRSTISSDVRELFQRVAKLRGVAVAAARDGRCQECHLLLRPADVLRPEAQRRDHAVPAVQPHPVLRAARPPSKRRQP